MTSIMSTKIVLLSALLHLGHCKPVSTFPLLYQVGQTYHYSYTTETVFNEASRPGQKDIGFKFSATIELTPVWSSSKEFLIKLSVTKPKLHSASRPDVVKDLKGLPRLPIFFQWDSGKVGRVYASEDDSTLAINIKKGVVSMFQLRLEDGNHEEVDSSGECDVSYSKEGDIIKRIKSGCQNIETTGQYSSVNPFTSVAIDFRSQTTYYISDDLIQSAVGIEEHTATLNLEQTVSTKITARQDLKMVKSTKKKKVPTATLR